MLNSQPRSLALAPYTSSPDQRERQYIFLGDIVEGERVVSEALEEGEFTPLPVTSLVKLLPLLAAHPLRTPATECELPVLFAGDVAAPDDTDEDVDSPLREILLRM